MMRRAARTLLFLLVLSAVPALACPLCYAPGRGDTASQAAFKRAIITLLLPPVGIMVGLVGVAFRYKRQGREQAPDAVAAGRSVQAGREQ